ncbi:MAG TPA: hypothetical protein PLL36_00310 [Candidatus Hydrogenedentes bacterium]|nr:hypothetical protein [Candidatus Hydrogenedentota bacterium]
MGENEEFAVVPSLNCVLAVFVTDDQEVVAVRPSLYRVRAVFVMGE